MLGIKNKIREQVSGKRNRIKDRDNNVNLDLTYITGTVLAMSFPASSATQKLYRNDINEVANYMDKNHPSSYYIYNMSNRAIDNSKFHDQVESYDWEDHHSPSLLVLFQSCHHMFNYMLENPNNVIVVHCNAGKGRTGTSIASFLLYSKLASNFIDAITYYGWKRFETGRGVT